MKYERWSDHPDIEIATHPQLYFQHAIRLKIDKSNGRIVITPIDHAGNAIMNGVDITDLVRR